MKTYLTLIAVLFLLSSCSPVQITHGRARAEIGTLVPGDIIPIDGKIESVPNGKNYTLTDVLLTPEGNISQLDVEPFVIILSDYDPSTQKSDLIVRVSIANHQTKQIHMEEIAKLNAGHQIRAFNQSGTDIALGESVSIFVTGFVK